MSRRVNRICAGIAIVAALVMALRIAATWGVFNDVIDEPYHIGAGLAMYEVGRHACGIQHPPLPRLVGALPLIFGGVDFPGSEGLENVVDDLSAFDVGHWALLDSQVPYWDVLIRGRAAMLVFPLAAVLYVYLLGRYLVNDVAACIAAVFFSTDPTLLGHGGWVTTDVAACAGYLAATYHGLRLIARPTWRRMLGAGLALGLALSCKFSCAIVLPVLLLLWMLRGRRALSTASRVVPMGVGALLVALLALWGTYLFDVGVIDEFIIGDEQLLEPLPQWARHTPLPMPTAIIGCLVVAQHNTIGHYAYLNGHVNQTGWWYYFFEALVIKSPVPLVAGVVLALTALIRIKPRQPLIALAILLPGALFLLAGTTSGINIGVRHILPAIPFFYLFVAKCLTRRRWNIAAGVLIVGAFVETAAVHPDYLSFFNVLVGGPRYGEYYLLDSNLDWGQDLHRLKTWLDANAGERKVTLRLFGNPRLREWPHDNLNLASEAAPPGGLFAISKNYLYDAYPYIIIHRDGSGAFAPSVEWLRRIEPVARIGYSINVYDIDALPKVLEGSP